MQSEKTTGVEISRFFTEENKHPYDEIEWKYFDAVIKDGETGEVKFEQKEVEFPSFYTQQAVNIITSKYFKGQLGKEDREWEHTNVFDWKSSPKREWSYKQLIDRVVSTNTAWGIEQGYFKSNEDAKIHADELTYILLHQMAYFNSPVWFNIGFPNRPQTVSACFINSIDDTMESILDFIKTEGLIFRAGSGSGANVSTLRSRYEGLSTGGHSSGTLSFMKVFDACAGSVKSGGATRRAAKMVIMNVDHPEIVDFIQCKVLEEEKAFALIREGYDSSYNGDAYQTVAYQNGNNSVRATDEFMIAAEKKKDFFTKFVTSGKRHKKYSARMILEAISEATWKSGDPGMQFHDTINKWNTVSNTDTLNASNPCSEYIFTDDTSCNLASLNLMKFFDVENQEFNVDAYVFTAQRMATAMDIWIDKADYPTEKIGIESRKFRTIGLGYANLGSLIMAHGFPYESKEGCAIGAAVTSLLTASAANISAKNCKILPPFEKWEPNKQPMRDVLEMHLDAHKEIKRTKPISNLLKKAKELWEEAIVIGSEAGYRNAYWSNCAPTGTIGLAMDCDTLGPEPELALVKYKKLAGSDVTIQIVNNTVPVALKSLGYNEDDIEDIKKHILEKNTVEGCSKIKEEHIPIFDTSFNAGGERYISYMGHLNMLASITPFFSGAISKTVNMPKSSTVEDILDTYIKAWKMGIKCIAIYRDGSKGSQVLSTVKETRSRATRLKLPDDTQGLRHKFSIDGSEVYIHTGQYEDGSLGEVFLTMGKDGSIIQGLLNAVATDISVLLQYGVPLQKIIAKHLHSKFEPHGFTSNKEIPMASSILDYIMKYLALNYLTPEERKVLNISSTTERKQEAEGDKKAGIQETKPRTNKGKSQKTTSVCPNCSNMMSQNGGCMHCENCGHTTGCS